MLGSESSFVSRLGASASIGFEVKRQVVSEGKARRLARRKGRPVAIDGVEVKVVNLHGLKGRRLEVRQQT